MPSRQAMRFRQFLAVELGYHPSTIAARYYDAMDRTAIPFPAHSLTMDPIHRFATVNEYILDGYLYGNVRCYTLSPYPRGKDELVKDIPPHLSSKQWWGEVSYQIAVTSFQIRAGQKYHDGNHRTAIAYIIETCYDFGRTLETPPLIMYYFLSCRSYRITPSEAITELRKMINHARFGPVTIEDREEAMLRVKEIPIWVSGLWEVVRMLHLKSVVEAIGLLREMKWSTPREYRLLRMMHEREVEAALKRRRNPGPDKDLGVRRKKFRTECDEYKITFVESEA